MFELIPQFFKRRNIEATTEDAHQFLTVKDSSFRGLQ